MIELEERKYFVNLSFISHYKAEIFLRLLSSVHKWFLIYQLWFTYSPRSEILHQYCWLSQLKNVFHTPGKYDIFVWNCHTTATVMMILWFTSFFPLSFLHFFYSFIAQVLKIKLPPDYQFNLNITAYASRVRNVPILSYSLSRP